MTREQFEARVRAAYPGADVVAVATVLWVGWESDNYIALVRGAGPGGLECLVTTNHDQIADATVEDLRAALERSKDSIGSIRTLLDLRKG